MRKVPKIKKTCLFCQLEFEIDSWRLNDKKNNRGRFCSIPCNNKYHSGKNSPFFGLHKSGVNSPTWKGGKHNPNCMDCNKQVSNPTNKRCRKCSSRFQSGSNHWAFGKKRPEISGKNHKLWKGGITSIDILERKKFRRTMQKLIFERDNYTCQICESKYDLQVDHIQKWSEYVEFRFSMDNCRTVCAKCHYRITFGREMPTTVKGWGHNLLRRVNS